MIIHVNKKVAVYRLGSFVSPNEHPHHETTLQQPPHYHMLITHSCATVLQNSETIKLSVYVGHVGHLYTAAF